MSRHASFAICTFMVLSLLVPSLGEAWTAVQPPGQALAASPSPRVPIGQWTSAEISLIQYRNVTTGVNAPTSGSHIELDVTPDGRYTYSTLLQITSYSCVDSLFAHEAGKATWMGTDRLTLVPASNTLTSRDTCVSKFNYQRTLPLSARTYRWKIDHLQRGTKLCLQSLTGQSKPGCFSRSGDSSAAPAVEAGDTAWKRRSSGSQDVLRGISCRSTSACLAVGESGVVLRSPDGGSTWVSASSPNFDDNIKAITCPTTAMCVAVGPDDILLGGGNGRLNAQNSDKWLVGVDCPSVTVCVAVGVGGAVMTSTDGGASWKVRSLGISNLLNSVSCPSQTQCVAVGGSWGEQGIILTSADGGVTWSRRLANNKYQLDSVSCPTARLCVAVGGNTFDGIVQTSADGGATWNTHAPGIDDILQGNPLHGVTCSSATTCIAVGDRGTILNSVDGGATWSGQVAAGGDPSRPLRAVSCANASRCVAVGDSGMIIQLTK